MRKKRKKIRINQKIIDPNQEVLVLTTQVIIQDHLVQDLIVRVRTQDHINRGNHIEDPGLSQILLKIRNHIEDQGLKIMKMIERKKNLINPLKKMRKVIKTMKKSLGQESTRLC